MNVIKKKKFEKEVIDDVLCDCCGKSVKTEYGFEKMSLSAFWGYMSKNDLEHWEADLCEQCVEEKLGFIKFKKSMYDPT